MRYLDPDAEEWLTAQGLPPGFLHGDPPVRLSEGEFLRLHEETLRELELLGAAAARLAAASDSTPLLEDLRVTVEAAGSRIEAWLTPLQEEVERRRRFRDPNWVRGRLAATRMPLQASAPALGGLGGRVPPLQAAYKGYRQPILSGAPFLVDRLRLDKAEDAIAHLLSQAPIALEAHTRALQEVSTLLEAPRVTLDDDLIRQPLLRAIHAYQQAVKSVVDQRKDLEEMVEEVKRTNKVLPSYSSVQQPERLIAQGTALSGSLWEVARMLEALQKQAEAVAREMAHLTTTGAAQVWVTRVFAMEDRGFPLVGPYILALGLARGLRQDLQKRLQQARQQEERLLGLRPRARAT